ncbi:MAG: sugar ABC transporter permease [Lachnospiraceae bacterium]|nr:sugar ABC transporter permease [Lachnospiraceae bacterium]
MKNEKLKAILKQNAMVIVLVLVYLFFVITTGGTIASPDNFENLINQNAYVFILGIGMMMCMLTGGNIDLSCGSVVCFLGAVLGVFMVKLDMGVGVSLLLVLGVGLAYGAILGYAIAYLNIPPWIATLAGYLAFRGLGTAVLTTKLGEADRYAATSAIPFTDHPSFINMFSGKVFETPYGELNIVCIIVGVLAAAIVAYLNFSKRASKIKKGYEAESKTMTIVKTAIEVAVIVLFAVMLSISGGIPTVLIWVVLLLVIYSFITERTTLGRYLLAVGGNGETSRLSGINTKLVLFGAYMNMAFLTTITTFATASRYTSANSFAGKDFEMDAIAACVVGGVSAYGGSGTVFGMVIGALLIGVINLGMFLMNIDDNWQKVVKGLVLLAAVVFDILSKKSKALKK